MAKRAMRARFEGRRSYTEQAKILAFDGTERDVVFSVTYRHRPNNTTFITIADITARLRAERGLAPAPGRLRAARVQAN